MLNTTFRNALVASSLMVGASLLMAPMAMADDTSGGEVTGSVAAINTVAFTPTTGTAITAGQAVAAYPIGALAITNNSAAGWTLEVQSANGGELVREEGGGNAIEYTALTVVAIDGATITPVTFAAAATDVMLIDAVYSDTVAAGVTGQNVTAAIAADQHVPQGTYADTLTFTITAK